MLNRILVASTCAVLTTAAISCGVAGPVPGNPPPDWDTDGILISLEEFRTAFYGNKDFMILDARPPADYEQIHIAFALSVPYYAIDECSGGDDGCFGLPKDVWIATYCACPNSESRLLAEGLQERGYPMVKAIREGLMPWIEGGHPVEKGSSS